MPLKTQSTSGGSRAGFHHTCPRCGSSEVRRLATIHEAGLSATPSADKGSHESSALAEHAAPPTQKSIVWWGTLAGAALVVALGSLARAGPGTGLAAGVALLAAALAFRASRYNRTVYPGLHDLWARSYMCGRCGEIFAE